MILKINVLKSEYADYYPELYDQEYYATVSGSLVQYSGISYMLHPIPVSIDDAQGYPFESVLRWRPGGGFGLYCEWADNFDDCQLNYIDVPVSVERVDDFPFPQ